MLRHRASHHVDLKLAASGHICNTTHFKLHLIPSIPTAFFVDHGPTGNLVHQ